MSSLRSSKVALARALEREFRRMSAQGVLLSNSVAERVGLSSSDLECLDVLVTAGAETLTPSQLAAATGLTSGAITGLVDRLEKAGLVRREADHSDRRKIRIVVNEERERQVRVYFERLALRAASLWAQFTEKQLQTVLEFVRRTTELTVEEVAYIRTLPPLKPAKSAASEAIRAATGQPEEVIQSPVGERTKLKHRPARKVRRKKPPRP